MQVQIEENNYDSIEINCILQTLQGLPSAVHVE
jgi:hypothetical protein